MVSLSVLQGTAQDMDLEGFKDHLEKGLESEGYTLIRKCSCKQDPPKKRVQELHEMFERYFKSTGKFYQPRDEQRLYREIMNCFHYKCPGLGNVVLTVEGFEEVMGDLQKRMRQGFIEGVVVGNEVRRKGGSILERFRESFKHRRKTGERYYSPSVGTVSLYTYGNSAEGREEDTCFACREGKISHWNQSWGQRLGLPQTVKRVDENLLKNSSNL